ncbi:yippee family protein [Drepanopeziza brunnea f. sp. 'multigermtubi' MB_m1]|uniref:Yippee family protein n=1 Tax=Marssonina brunnea f. sp. multigermtubi (strain MB_m1) TaxID=1072389 RepID=K1W937_MARBU|nr:yippee family protein [Drepanopeziza brunnea f. sp. 'multigermtubi' MB_m1]EKD13720.1 yippee family protein [Drepanopeziza brunnea f. sp. 'multigermtubi' MB_m1]
MPPPDSRPPFPTYLLPSFTFPFRRRQSSISTTVPVGSPPELSFSLSSSANTSPSSSLSSTHFLPKETIHEGRSKSPRANTQANGDLRLRRAQPNTLKCVTCASDIAFADQVVSKGFTGRHGRAYLVSLPPTEVSMSAGKKDPGGLPNTKIGRSVNRELLTGQHVVADVSCSICGEVLGWKYVDAKEAAQKYKIGKYILEMKRVVLSVGWEDAVGDGEDVDDSLGVYGRDEDEDAVVFDSEDEDECEALFTGTWDPEVVAKRRGKRIWGRKKRSVEV